RILLERLLRRLKSLLAMTIIYAGSAKMGVFTLNLTICIAAMSVVFVARKIMICNFLINGSTQKCSFKCFKD
ncbi:hypothetical protein, partial [Pedobacter miscanthi]|uniref:hypothetical protein n=1 Tax=Pedobacter miscanthi TaxID=2259170 RepID=UPI00292E2D36